MQDNIAFLIEQINQVISLIPVPGETKPVEGGK